MHRIVSLLMGILVAFCITAASAADPAGSDKQYYFAAKQGLSEILDLWRAERFEELYSRTVHSGEGGRYYFLEKMVNSIRKPACCWEKMQDVEAVFLSPDRVTLIARVGMEMDGVDVKFYRKSFDMVKGEGVWKIPMEDILSLADTSGYRVFPREIIEKPLP